MVVEQRVKSYPDFGVKRTQGETFQGKKLKPPAKSKGNGFPAYVPWFVGINANWENSLGAW